MRLQGVSLKYVIVLVEKTKSGLEEKTSFGLN